MRQNRRKDEILLGLIDEYMLNVFVETGTYHGGMVEAISPHVEHTYSIEFGDKFYDAASEKFKDNDSITIIHGDSGYELGGLIRIIKQPALFWLDAHYSGGDTAKGESETPIAEELKHIVASALNHVIVIDDANSFIDNPKYPGVPELFMLLYFNTPHKGFDFCVTHDNMIRIVLR